MSNIPKIKISKAEDDKLVVQRGKKKATLSYQQVFALGHSFFNAGQYALARDVFSALAKIRGRGPRAKIMLARCKAEIESFDACSEILHDIFDDEHEAIAEELQGAFVFHTMGMQEDAIREMAKAVKHYPDFPTAFLYLGDLYLEKGNREKAAYCWKAAMKRDRKRGAIAVTARKQLARLAKSKSKGKSKKSANKPTRSEDKE